MPLFVVLEPEEQVCARIMVDTSDRRNPTKLQLPRETFMSSVLSRNVKSTLAFGNSAWTSRSRRVVCV